MIYYAIFVLLTVLTAAPAESKTFKKGSLVFNDIGGDHGDTNKQWQGLWFPHPPSYNNNVDKDVAADMRGNQITGAHESSASYQGLWFPHPPNYTVDAQKLKPSKKTGASETSTSWQGLWFPHAPEKDDTLPPLKTNIHHVGKHLDKNECDNGLTNIGIDFDPDDKRHSYNYLCLGNRTQYEPNFKTFALQTELLVPSAYQPPVRCLSDRLTYDSLPTFGAYRPLAPKFGSYKFLPPQRWLHSLADGAIVMLYHPCAFSGQIKQLENVVKGCLYRHIITPSQALTPQRPLAVMAWGKSLQMSVVDERLVISFIKENAKLGLRGKQQKLKLSAHLYEAGLLTEAHLVTDEQDTELCGYKDA